MSERTCWLALLLVAACTRSTNLADSAVITERDGGGLDAQAQDAGPMFDRDDAGRVRCGSVTCECSDGIDNDGDGETDGFDPECTGAGDAFESSFATGRKGEEQSDKCQDCFWDLNSGPGDDGCRWASSCSIDGTSASGNGQCRDCTPEPACIDTCTPLVPNGCDCFGCCGIWREGTIKNILLGSSSCTSATLDNPQLCTPCIPSAECANPCGRCELCPGRRVVDLPADCGTGYSCDEGEVCEVNADCSGPLESCQQGCCRANGI